MPYLHSQLPSLPAFMSSGVTGVARNGAEMGFQTTIYKNWGTSFTISDGKKFTVSGWFGGLDHEQYPLGSIWQFVSLAASLYTSFSLTDDGAGGHWLNILFLVNGGEDGYIDTQREVTLDPTKKHYFCLTFDSTQANEDDRLKLWLGEHGGSAPVAQDIWGGTGGWIEEVNVPITQNAEITYIDAFVNAESIGSQDETTSAWGLRVGDFYHLDGQAKQPTDFGAVTGTGWKPIDYVGAYGLAGYHLDFAVDTDMTNDVSGNNNDFTSPTYWISGSPINISSMTMFGDMTAGGGLNAAKDGTLSQAAASSAQKSGTGQAYIGVDLGTAMNVANGEIFPSNDQGFVSGSNPTVSLSMRGHSSQPTDLTNATTAGSSMGTVGGFTDANGSGEGSQQTMTNPDPGTARRYVWFLTNSHTAAKNVAEIRLLQAVATSMNDGTREIVNWL